MIKALRFTLLLVAMFLGIATAHAAEDHATREQAQDMVKKAVDFIKANGPDKAYSEIDKKDGQFTDRDLYIGVYDMAGKCIAHGFNSKLIGKDLIDTEDADGKAYIKERIESAKTKQSFWQEYKFADPVTKKLMPKQTYCERLNDTIVCAGIYKP